MDLHLRQALNRNLIMIPTLRVGLPYACLRLGGLALLILANLAALAADINTPNTGREADTATVTAPSPRPVEQAKQCYNGCQQWGQMCNVDPRGVYKCQRRCEKFGEICE